MSRVESREYDRRNSIVFRRTAEKYGGLSNMAPGFPLHVNGVRIRTSEALYQACRFPHLPDVQRLIIDQGSPMAAKMRSKPFRDRSRPDWDAVRVNVMRWCLRVKLAQNWDTFGALLKSTGGQPIVEESKKDDFWGAHPLEDGGLVGANVLGRLLMELREEFLGPDSRTLRIVAPLSIPDFLLYGEPIAPLSRKTVPMTLPDRLDRLPVLELGADAVLQPTSQRTPPVIAPVPPSEVVTSHSPADVHDTKMTRHPKRLIEVDLPIKRISAHARREKSIRHGHISTLHIWWARRPLAACRSVMCAALWPDPDDPLCPSVFREKARTAMLHWTPLERQKLLSEASRRRFEAARKDPQLFDHPSELRGALLDFIADFADWNNSIASEYLKTSRALTQAAHEALGGTPETRPLTVDPFAGGGSIPLEALRVGADAYASDLNPVAVLLNKVVLEYIPKYRSQLADEVRKWGSWIKLQAETELGEFYPKDLDGATPIAYLWARTILSEAPSEGGLPVEVPLMRSMWLAKGQGRNRALRWKRDAQGSIQTEIADVTYVQLGSSERQHLRVRRPLVEIFEPKSASDVEAAPSMGGAATCPITGFTTSVESVRRQLSARSGGAGDARLMCVVTVRANATGRFYRVSTDSDVRAAQAAREALTSRYGFDAKGVSTTPDGKLNHLRGFFNVVLYGMTTWGDLFTPRQQLTLGTLTRLVTEAGQHIAKEHEKGLSDAIQTCLGLAVSRHADINASLAMWHNTRELITHVFGRQALPMVWDFAEANTFSEASGAFLGGVDWIARVLDQPIATAGHVEQASATAHPLPEDAADLLFTDPPYYAAIPYADLSDFFYSWLRRALIEVHPDLLRPDLSPKDEECVALSHRAAMYRNKDSAWFEAMMTDACREGRRVTKPTGVGVFVFANKETAGWEAMLAALVSAGWIVTASWPIDTEMGNRLRARNSAALASSIHLVCRPREAPDGSVRGDDIGDWREVLQSLPKRIHEWMPRLAEEGVVGADAIFACLGPALEIFSRHSRVEKASGEAVTLKEYLEHVWAAVAREALSTVLQDGDSGSLEPDARLTVIWLWTFGGRDSSASDDAETEQDDAEEDHDEAATTPTGYVLEFDAARKIAQGLGANLEALEHVVVVRGEKARLLAVADRTNYLFGKADGVPMAKRASKKKQIALFAEIEEAAAEQGWGDVGAPKAGTTTLDRVHQAMLLFASGRGEALKRFIVEEGIGRQPPFWKLSQALAALYPSGSEERRWVEGVLARKKGLGFG
jgi:putative DNA methylase